MRQKTIILFFALLWLIAIVHPVQSEDRDNLPKDENKANVKQSGYVCLGIRFSFDCAVNREALVSKFEKGRYPVSFVIDKQLIYPVRRNYGDFIVIPVEPGEHEITARMKMEDKSYLTNSWKFLVKENEVKLFAITFQPFSILKFSYYKKWADSRGRIVDRTPEYDETKPNISYTREIDGQKQFQSYEDFYEMCIEKEKTPVKYDTAGICWSECEIIYDHRIISWSTKKFATDYGGLVFPVTTIEDKEYPLMWQKRFVGWDSFSGSTKNENIYEVTNARSFEVTPKEYKVKVHLRYCDGSSTSVIENSEIVTSVKIEKAKRVIFKIKIIGTDDDGYRCELEVSDGGNVGLEDY